MGHDAVVLADLRLDLILDEITMWRDHWAATLDLAARMPDDQRELSAGYPDSVRGFLANCRPIHAMANPLVLRRLHANASEAVDIVTRHLAHRQQPDHTHDPDQRVAKLEARVAELEKALDLVAVVSRGYRRADCPPDPG